MIFVMCVPSLIQKIGFIGPSRSFTCLVSVTSGDRGISEYRNAEPR